MRIEELFQQFPQIETEHLILSQIKPEDDEDLYSFLSDSKVMKYQGKEPLNTIEESRGLINRHSERFKSISGIRWGISRKEDKVLIGTCGYHNWVKQHFCAEIVYELSKKYWRQGIMLEALDAIISFGFDKMGLNRIEALVYPQNIVSRRILTRLGFQEEGLLKEYALYKGKFTDLVIFAILKKNYLQRV